MAPESVFAIMDEICAWLKANGIRPGDVPVDEVPKVVNGGIAVRVYLRNAEDRKYLVDGELAMETRTVPLATEPPEVLRPWLAGEVASAPTSRQRARSVAKLRARFPDSPGEDPRS